MNKIQNKLSLNLLYILPILFIVLYFTPQSALAGIFNPPPTDKSVEYLGMIFGGKLGNINLGLTQDSNHVLGHLFQIFNGIILAVAMFVLSYVGVVSTVNTAQEGQVMGKKWSSVWIPLRSSVGLLLLAPVPGSGYSLLQVTLMWIVLNGVGAADKLWNVVLVNLANGVSITQNINIETEDEQTNQENLINTNKLINHGQEISKKLLNNLICLEIIHKHTNLQELSKRNATLDFHFTNLKKNTGDHPSISETLMFGANDPAIPSRQDICGHIDIETALTTDDIQLLSSELSSNQKANLVSHIHHIKKITLMMMINSLRHAAKNISQVQPNTAGNVDLTTFMYRGLLQEPVIIYKKAMSSLSGGHLRSLVNIHINKEHPLLKDIKSVIDEGEKYGWITAGSFYYLFSQHSPQALISAALNPPTSNEADPFGNNNKWFTDKITPATFGVEISHFNPYINDIKTHKDIGELFTVHKKFKTLDGKKDFQENKLSEKSKLPDISGLKNDLNNSFNKLDIDQKIKKQFEENFEDYKLAFDSLLFNEQKGDPLIALAKFGVKLMNGAEVCWGTIITGTLFPDKSIVSPEDIMKLPSIMVGLLPAVLIIVGAMWTIGASLAIYTPMVPYFMFMVTALGWLILVIEAIIAAPIVALGLIAPAQEELGKIVPALGIIASMFLRPILMIIGLIMGAKLFKAAISMVNLGFQFSFSLLRAQTGISLFSWVVETILYTAFILTLVNKSYALIYQVPDKILRWIGITGEPTDVSSIKETQQTFEQQSKEAIGPAQGAAKRGAEILDSQIKEKDPTGLKGK